VAQRVPTAELVPQPDDHRPGPTLREKPSLASALRVGPCVIHDQKCGSASLSGMIWPTSSGSISGSTAKSSTHAGPQVLSGGGRPVTHRGCHYRLDQIEPAPVAAPALWTGSVGPMAATGRVADGWLPGHAADWLSERYRESRAIIDEAASAVGRDPARFARYLISADASPTGRWLPRVTTPAAG
jgi:Luciferase-like monooxygenase